MATQYTDPQRQNIEEVLEMIREIGGTAEAINNPSPAQFAFLLRELQSKMTTHTLIVGLVPRGKDATHFKNIYIPLAFYIDTYTPI